MSSMLTVRTQQNKRIQATDVDTDETKNNKNNKRSKIDEEEQKDDNTPTQQQRNSNSNATVKPCFNDLPSVIFSSICSYLTIHDKLQTVIRLSHQQQQLLTAPSANNPPRFTTNHLTVTSAFIPAIMNNLRLRSLLSPIQSPSLASCHLSCSLPLNALEQLQLLCLCSPSASSSSTSSASLSSSSVASQSASFLFSSLTSLSLVWISRA